MVQWIVKGSGKVKITYDSNRARNRTVELEL
jgi:hypothetical protein